MFYMYVIKSKVSKTLYFGYSSDLKKRVKEHNEKKSKYTQTKTPWSLVYYEAYKSAKDARARERQLKKYAKSYAMLKRRIKNSM